MADSILGYRQKIDGFFRPSVWWSIWVFGALFLLYSIFFHAILLLKNNYGLPGYIAMQDMNMGRLFFFATNMPLASFTFLFAGHVTLALYKMNKVRKV